ncbi:hypothetical protein BGW80DRAFT_1464590 [Lactifluus volemus]|nr:hypothetical protein BGW80DRAFT_1464590 [Lactifluus volemus]
MLPPLLPGPPPPAPPPPTSHASSCASSHTSSHVPRLLLHFLTPSYPVPPVRPVCSLAPPARLAFSRAFSREDYRGKVDIPLKHMLYAMSVMTGFIFLQTIYQTAEFLDGFQGTIASTQLLLWCLVQSAQTHSAVTILSQLTLTDISISA